MSKNDKGHPETSNEPHCLEIKHDPKVSFFCTEQKFYVSMQQNINMRHKYA